MKYVYVNQLPPQVRAEVVRDSYKSICESLCVEHEHIEEVTDAVLTSKLCDAVDCIDIDKAKYFRWLRG